MIARALLLATALLAASSAAVAQTQQDTFANRDVLAAPALRGSVQVSGDIVRIGDNLFVETPASGTPQDGVPNTDGYGDVQQGNLEQANVEAVTEISDLIAAQRAYEMNGKVITAADQMLQATSSLMR